MIINFNSKYFTLAAIIFGVYIFHDIRSGQKEGIRDFEEVAVTPNSAQHVLQIDPAKPDSERTMFEKAIYKYALTKQAEIQMKQSINPNYKPVVQPQNVPASFGDTQ